jgi:hypothetical protein
MFSRWSPSKRWGGSVKLRRIVVLLSLCFLPLPVFAQVTTATLSGTVADATGAVIPGARVTVKNLATKVARTLASNGSGVFAFPGLDSGDYSVTINYKGFKGYELNSIHLNPNDTRNLTNIRMTPGEVNEIVNIDATTGLPVEDDGSRSSLITAKDLSKLSLEGREVTELLKILPGSAINSMANGAATSNAGVGDSNTSYDPGTVGFKGGAGNYSVSGSPVNGVTIRSDGANLTDPATGSGALQTVNAESTAEVKVQTSNFGADNANGPLVINAVGKSGATDFHGSLYVYGRTGQLNSTDSIATALNTTKPADRYIYPGASLGGPVVIPGTHWNKQKRLVFFVSGEDYIQRNIYAYNNVSYAVTHALVPTAGMREGNFSASELAKYLPPGIPVCDPSLLVVCPNLLNFTSPIYGTYNFFKNVNEVPATAPNGQQINCKGLPGDCLAGHEDIGSRALLNLLPLPNTPGGLTTANGYNFTHVDTVDQDIYQAHGRLDYSAGRSKIYATFTAENGGTTAPQQLSSGVGGAVDTPGGSLEKTYTDSGSINWTMNFSATTTNELFASGVYSDQISSPDRPGSLLASTIGFPYGGAYNNNSLEYPSLNTSNSSNQEGIPQLFAPDYSYGSLYNKAFNPSVGDNFTKLVGKHTLRTGFNLEQPRISGTLDFGSAPGTNGQIASYYISPTFYLPTAGANGGEPYTMYHNTCWQSSDSTCALSNTNSNILADYFTGEMQQYYQSNEIPHLRLHAFTTSMFVTDDWKITRKLNITAGVRVEHIGRWIDDHGFGAAVFSPSDYAAEANNLNIPKVPLPGFRWHSIDSSVPISGFAKREFFYEPRVGFSLDVYGTGKTFLAGGWGQYRFRDGQQDSINSILASNGLRSLEIINPGIDPNQPGQAANAQGINMAYVQSLHASTSPGVETSTFQANQGGYATASASTFYGVNQNDSQVPMTTNYSLTVTQYLPKNISFSVGYVGNHSAYLLDDNGGSGPTISNINAIPLGGLFQPDPNPLSSQYQIVFPPNQAGFDGDGQIDDYRPYPRYHAIQIESHVLTANYNAAQVVVEHSKGWLYYKLNYTWSKNMGEKGGYQNGNAGDSFNVRNNYGPLAYDRTNIFNASYNFDLGSRYHGNAILRGALNGWQVSGITNLQSGANLLALNYSTNFYLSGQPGPSTQDAIGNLSYLGTPDINLQPTVLCNPTANLKRRQYANAACFGYPAQGGSNGVFNLPYIHGPAFFQSDLTLIKDFHLRHDQTLEFRGAAFNFLNYKLKTFTNIDASSLQLTYPLSTDQAFGTSFYNTGRRVVEIAARYSF